jgi:hypothetical protein
MLSPFIFSFSHFLTLLRHLAVISGDTMDLEIFLTGKEGRSMCRRSGSLPWLFPMKEELFPDICSRV